MTLAADPVFAGLQIAERVLAVGTVDLAGLPRDRSPGAGTA